MSDAAVRRIARRGYWREREAQVVIDALQASGESLNEFCARLGLKEERVTRWRTRLGSESVRFHPVQLSMQPTSHDEITIELVSGTVVHVPRGFAVEDLRGVLAALGGEQ